MSHQDGRGLGTAVPHGDGSQASADTHRFYTVAEAAKMLRTCDMTLYRAINAGQFPAVRIRGRLIIPAQALEAMGRAASAGGCVVDAADWVRAVA